MQVDWSRVNTDKKWTETSKAELLQYACYSADAIELYSYTDSTCTTFESPTICKDAGNDTDTSDDSRSCERVANTIIID
jgi:hypothetical protein